MAAPQGDGGRNRLVCNEQAMDQNFVVMAECCDSLLYEIAHGFVLYSRRSGAAFPAFGFELEVIPQGLSKRFAVSRFFNGQRADFGQLPLAPAHVAQAFSADIAFEIIFTPFT